MKIKIVFRTQVLHRWAVRVFAMGYWLLLIAAVSAVACNDHQAAYPSSQLHISKAWSPPAPPHMRVHAGYFTLANHAKTARVIIHASSPQYERIDMHRTVLTNGIASMKAVDLLSLAPGEQVRFAPGGLYLMMRATGKRHVGDRFPVTLHFQNGESLTLQMTVQAHDISGHAMTPASHHGMHQHHEKH
ncbi:hypothetical protein C2W62_29935 [Candidatus Entotheonella serta]|nr:hypothetical protein C2W62_29935 [Candidatus Entotheonella serta]